MPFGTEIQLGFIGPDAIDAAAAAMGLKITDEDGEVVKAAIVGEDERWIEIQATSIQSTLQEAYLEIASRFGWTLVSSKPDDGEFTFSTEYGTRKTRCFSLAIQFDSNEVGDTVEDMTLGINLTARYRPVLLDACTAADGAKSVQVFDEDALRICRDEIQRRMPAFKDAKLFVRDIFY